MADWFRCDPLRLLAALGEGLSDDAQLVFVKALLLIYQRDGRVAAASLRQGFPNWRPKRLQRAVQELLDTGKLIGTATGELHNARAMHELQQVATLSAERAQAGSKGGRSRADRERLAKKIAERNLSPDLFEPDENPVETPLNDHSTTTQPSFKSGSVDFENDYLDTIPNENNGSGQAKLKHAGARETETEVETDTPFSVPPIDPAEIETLDGEVIDEGKTARKQPLPPGWLPTRAGLSERVQGVVEAWGDDELDEQAIKFLEWAEATNARFVQWDRAFGNWCMKHHEQRKRKRHGKAAGFTVPDLG